MQRRFSSSAADRRTNADNKRKFREKRSSGLWWTFLLLRKEARREQNLDLLYGRISSSCSEDECFKDAGNGGLMGTRVQLQVNSSQNQVRKEKSFKDVLLNNGEVRDKKAANDVKESSQKLFHLEGENIESIEANLDDRPVISMDKSLIQRWSNCLVGTIGPTAISPF
ncbi:hypothetical protein J1N35_023725 [Gossypium stocksii]|uniref:Uncharacterized protein n=1 Tax=Gossypium stocksii TaxID=47602 RepID=A0A9D4A4N5_9ROSI|nr:hypothetical protein J1N35_023725 [Gossypium stocksii]